MKLSLLDMFLILTVAALSVSLFLSVSQTDPVVFVKKPNLAISWKLRKTILNESTEWDRVDMNPPLSVAKAISICENISNCMNKETDYERVGGWTLVSIAFVSLDSNYVQLPRKGHWCYLAEFEGSRLPGSERRALGSSGPPPEFTALILLDEQIIAGEGSWQDSLFRAVVTKNQTKIDTSRRKR